MSNLVLKIHKSGGITRRTIERQYVTLERLRSLCGNDVAMSYVDPQGDPIDILVEDDVAEMIRCCVDGVCGVFTKKKKKSDVDIEDPLHQPLPVSNTRIGVAAVLMLVFVGPGKLFLLAVAIWFFFPGAVQHVRRWLQSPDGATALYHQVAAFLLDQYAAFQRSRANKGTVVVAQEEVEDVQQPADQSKLKQLMDLGFKNSLLNAELLKKHDGDVNKVVDVLIARK